MPVSFYSSYHFWRHCPQHANGPSINQKWVCKSVWSRSYWLLASNSNSFILYAFKIPPSPAQNGTVWGCGVSGFQDFNIECSWVKSHWHNMETEDRGGTNSGPLNVDRQRHFVSRCKFFQVLSTWHTHSHSHTTLEASQPSSTGGAPFSCHPHLLTAVTRVR